jgi:hypothetical protein
MRPAVFLQFLPTLLLRPRPGVAGIVLAFVLALSACTTGGGRAARRSGGV